MHALKIVIVQSSALGTSHCAMAAQMCLFPHSLSHRLTASYTCDKPSMTHAHRAIAACCMLCMLRLTPP